MGKHGLGQRNDTCRRLCDLSDMNELVITGTLFPHKTIHNATWTSPDVITKSQIDHILISRRFRNSVKDTRVFRSADIGSDRYLVCMKVKLRLRNEPKGKKKHESNVRYCKAERWKHQESIFQTIFADDIALLSATKQQIQDKTRKLNVVECTSVGMKVSVEKTKTMRMNSKNQDRVTIDGQDIEDV